MMVWGNTEIQTRQYDELGVDSRLAYAKARNAGKSHAQAMSAAFPYNTIVSPAWAEEMAGNLERGAAAAAMLEGPCGYSFGVEYCGRDLGPVECVAPMGHAGNHELRVRT